MTQQFFRIFIGFLPLLSYSFVQFSPSTRLNLKQLFGSIKESSKDDPIIWNNEFLKATVTETLQKSSTSTRALTYNEDTEAMFSMSYDPLEMPNQKTMERDLEDVLRDRAMRFFDRTVVRAQERCYLVGLEDRSALYNARIFDVIKNEEEESESDDKDDAVDPPSSTVKESSQVFSLEESLTELSELAGAAGLTVVGSTYQRVQRPSAEYFIGVGKTKEIQRTMDRLQCTCVVFDTELTPSQQKNLELAFNEGDRMNPKNKKQTMIKVIDRTALILDIFAQHAKTKEGQLQVQLALLTYRLPRLTNMWTHLERQSSSRGRSNGGVGLRGPGEKQLESDRRQMKAKIAALTRTIDAVRAHRSMHRRRRRRLGIPVIALVGYTNAGKSTILNAFTQGGVFVADMLFATLDPTTRMINLPSVLSAVNAEEQAAYKSSMAKIPDILLTDTVGFIQKLPTNLVAAFRATLEEIEEADILLHVADISNESWKKQEAAVLSELSSMGLSSKPLLTVWNKLDRLSPTEQVTVHQLAATRSIPTVAVSATTGQGFQTLIEKLQGMISANMCDIACFFDTSSSTRSGATTSGSNIRNSNRMLSVMHQMGILDIVEPVGDQDHSFVFVSGKVPGFLYEQLQYLHRRQFREIRSGVPPQKSAVKSKDTSFVVSNTVIDSGSGMNKKKVIAEIDVLVSMEDLYNENTDNQNININNLLNSNVIDELMSQEQEGNNEDDESDASEKEDQIIVVDTKRHGEKIRLISQDYLHSKDESLLPAVRAQLKELLEDIQLSQWFDKDSNAENRSNGNLSSFSEQEEDIDWEGLAKGRHRAVKTFKSAQKRIKSTNNNLV